MTERMTSADLKEALRKPKGTKRVAGYQKVTVDGEAFDSKREANRWLLLRLLEKGGEIYDLRRQVSFPLFGRNDAIRTPTGRKMLYKADFVYRDRRLGNALVVEDAKGWATEIYKIKKAILAAQGIEVKEV
ncbi:MAG: DUF1064 domain-containing protein [Pseudomonadota bacterium]